MKSRRDEVARLAGVPVEQVLPVTPAEVRRLYDDRAPIAVVDVATAGASETGEASYLWRVGDTCYLDDATFGDVVALDDLRYDPKLGLYSIHW